MNYPKKEEYNVFKRISKKEKNTIGSLEEFLDLRFKTENLASLKYGIFFVPLLTYYKVVDLSKNHFQYRYMYLSVFVRGYRSNILELKELLNIKEFYSYRYQDPYGSCCDDLAGILFKNKQEKMLFVLKHVEILDRMKE
jgi:hypothetical protein